MRIGIDARMYGPSNSGLGRYVEQLITQLKYLDDEHEYVVFLKRDAFDSFDVPNKRWKKVLADVHWYGLAEQLRMPRYIKQHDVDLMHFPHWNVSWLYRKLFVVTIHDLTMFHYVRPEASTHGRIIFWIKDIVHRLLLRSVARRAKHIIATSEFTKRDIVETLRVNETKVHVTYQAATKIATGDTTDTWEQLQTKHNIESPYVLYVGNAYPHKNLERLVSAWGSVSEQCPNAQLVLAGKDSQWYQQLQQTAAWRQTDRIVYTGYVTDEELASLYAHAELYIFPSLYEGFGLPPLEAMAHGVPVISSHASCLPEVLGEAALYVDPEETDDIARGIIQGIEDADIRYTLRQHAKGELKLYSWKRLASQTIDCYRRALQEI